MTGQQMREVMDAIEEAIGPEGRFLLMVVDPDPGVAIVSVVSNLGHAGIVEVMERALPEARANRDADYAKRRGDVS